MVVDYNDKITKNTLEMRIEERIGRIISFGLFDRITGVKLHPSNMDKYVAAGNPGIVAQKYPHPVDIPDGFLLGGKKCHKEDYLYRTVFGNSMLVDGIHSGWELLLKPITHQEIAQGDFIVINVDKEYYKHRHHSKDPLFQLKLRRAIGVISPSETEASLCKKLEGSFAEPLDNKDLEDLSESLKDARTFYVNNEQLFLSVTYHKSDIHYSFHPTSSIKYGVVGAAIPSDNGVVFKTTDEF